MKALKKIDRTQRFLLIIIIVYCTIVATKNPAFLSLSTLFALLRSSAGTTILSMGVLMVMISGGIDVSFPAIAIFGGYASLRACMAFGITSMFLTFLISDEVEEIVANCNRVIVMFDGHVVKEYSEEEMKDPEIKEKINTLVESGKPGKEVAAS